MEGAGPLLDGRLELPDDIIKEIIPLIPFPYHPWPLLLITSKAFSNLLLPNITSVELVEKLTYRALSFKWIRAYFVALDFDQRYFWKLCELVKKHLRTIAPRLRICRLPNYVGLHQQVLEVEELFSNIQEMHLGDPGHEKVRLSIPANAKMFCGFYSKISDKLAVWEYIGDDGRDPFSSMTRTFDNSFSGSITHTIRTRPNSEQSRVRCNFLFHVVCASTAFFGAEKFRSMLNRIKKHDGTLFDIDHQAEPTGESPLAVALRTSLNKPAEDFYWLILLEYGADPLKPSYSTGLTPFMMAIYVGGSEAILDTLLNVSLKIHGESAYLKIGHNYLQGASALHYASISTTKSSLSWVLKHLDELGLSVNVQDRVGRTALHWAVQYRHHGLVRVFTDLLNLGADISIRTFDRGITVMQQIQMSDDRFHKVIRLIHTAMKRNAEQEGKPR